MTEYKITGTIEIDDILATVMVALGDPYDKLCLAHFVNELLVDENGGLICHSDVQVSEVKDEA